MKKKCRVVSLTTKDTPHNYNHLYLTSDDEIKVGDYYCNIEMRTSEYGVIKCETERLESLLAEKPEGYYKIIATTDPTLNLPMIPESFVKSYCKNPVDEVFVNIFPTLDENFDPTEEYVVEISPVETSWNKEQLEFWLYENVSAFFDTVVTDSRKKKMQTFLSTLDDLGQRFREFQEDMKADAYKREFEDREYYNSH